MIIFQEMIERDFAEYKPFLVEDYAQEIARNYHTRIEEARINSAKQTDELLPKGLSTPHHFLFNIISTEDQAEQRIGYLWIEVVEQQKRCYIFDIYLFEAYRGRGYGRQTLELLDAKMIAKKVERIGLNVFAHNTHARQLYSNMGYEIVSYNMQKWLTK